MENYINDTFAYFNAQLAASPLFRQFFAVPKPPNPNRKRNVQNLYDTARVLIAYLLSSRVAARHDVLLKHSITLLMSLIRIYDAEPAHFVQRFKTAAVWFTRWIATRDRTIGLVPEEMWDYDQNCPMILSAFILSLSNLRTNNPTFVFYSRFILSILNVYRNVVVPKALDTKTITEPSRVPELHEPLLIAALTSLGITPELFQATLNEKIATRKLHFTSASGPNGNAMQTAHLDGLAITRDKKLASSLKDFCFLTNQGAIWELLRTCTYSSKYGPNAKPISDLIHSKLHLIYEKGDKTRVIAMVDYWTQEAMGPLHDTIAHFLRQVPNDHTFDQDAGVAHVRQMTTMDVDSLHSYDLTAATDRLPVWYQRMILEYLLGSAKAARAWQAVMTNRGFKLGDSFLRYSVGQPIGIKSSFPIMALMHHVVVRICLIQAGLRSFDDYAILGDDMVIARAKPAFNYVDYMDRIGVPLSMPKSIVTWQGSGLAAEFCKRIFYRGIDFTPIPVGIAIRVIKSGRHAPALQNELSARELLMSNSEYWEFLSRILNMKWLKLIALINGIPGSVTGLVQPIPCYLAHLCIYTKVAQNNGLSPDDWINVSEFIDQVTAVKQAIQMIEIINDTSVNEALFRIAAKIKFPWTEIERYNPAFIDADYDPTTIHKGWTLETYHAQYTMAKLFVDWPTAFHKLRRVRAMHPYFDNLLQWCDELYLILSGQIGTDLTDMNPLSRQTFGYGPMIDLFGKTYDPRTFWFKRSLLRMSQIAAIVRDDEDLSSGTRDLVHVMAVVSIIKSWIKGTPRTIFTFKEPFSTWTVTISVRSGSPPMVSYNQPYFRPIGDIYIYLKELISDGLFR